MIRTETIIETCELASFLVDENYKGLKSITHPDGYNKALRIVYDNITGSDDDCYIKKSDYILCNRSNFPAEHWDIINLLVTKNPQLPEEFRIVYIG